MSAGEGTVADAARAVRFPLRLGVHLRWDGGEAKGVTRNLTRGGLGVRVATLHGRAPERGDALALVLELGGQRLLLRATLSWHRANAKDPRGAACHWLGLRLQADPADTARLEEALASARLGVLAWLSAPEDVALARQALGPHYALDVVATAAEAARRLDAQDYGVVLVAARTDADRDLLGELLTTFPADLAVKVTLGDEALAPAQRRQIFLRLPANAGARALRQAVDGAMQHYWARAEPRLYMTWAQHQAVGGHQPQAVDRATLLRRLGVFDELDDEARDGLAQAFERHTAPRGSTLFRAGDPGDALYVLTSGAARVLDGPHEVARIGPGAILGETALLLQQPRGATIELTVDSELLRLSKADFEVLLRDHPATGVSLCRELARRSVAPRRESTEAPLRVVAAVGLVAGARLAHAIEALGVNTALLCVDERLPEGLAQAPAVIEQPKGLTAAGLVRRLTELSHLFERVVLAVPPAPSEAALHAVSHADAVVSFDTLPAGIRGKARRVLTDTADDLRLERMARRVAKRTVGLVLSSGGAWGISHVGVIQLLREERIPVDLVAGASAGALFGAAFCLGWSTAQLRRFAKEALPKVAKLTGGLFDPALSPTAGIVRGRRTRDWLDESFRSRTVESLATPLHVVCADVSSGREQVLSHGRLADAVRASIGVPGFFVPWQVDGRWLVDGGMVNPLPLSTARENGADFIVAVAVTGAAANAPGAQAEGARAPSYMAQLVNLMAAMERETLKARHTWADVLLRPDVGRFSLIDYHQADVLVEAGVEAARGQLAAIRALGRKVRSS